MSAPPPAAAIVGGGVAGLSLARALARRGGRVTLLERAAGPDGASALPVALLNPWRGRKGAAHPDDLRGLAATWRWAAELTAEGRDPGARRDGVLRIPANARQARAWRDVAAAQDALAWIPAEEVPAPYHAPFGALLVRDGGLLEPARWLAALAASATAHGARIRTGAAVASVAPGPGGVWSLRDAAGAELASAPLVALCVGAHAAPALADADAVAAVPALERTRGEVVALDGGPALPHAVAGGLYGGTSSEGRTWVGGGHRPAEAADPAAPERLRAAFAWSVPALAEAPIGEVWSGVRAKRPDARPHVAELAPGLWWFGAFAGRGFLCAADAAERFAGR